jgi:hypothetical protein
MWLLGPPLQELPPQGDAPLPAEGPPHPPPFSQAEFLDSLQVPRTWVPLLRLGARCNVPHLLHGAWVPPARMAAAHVVLSQELGFRVFSVMALPACPGRLLKQLTPSEPEMSPSVALGLRKLVSLTRWRARPAGRQVPGGAAGALWQRRQLHRLLPPLRCVPQLHILVRAAAAGCLVVPGGQGVMT